MKPRIAWVTYDLPYPPVSGGKLRAYHLIKRLSPDFQIDLYSFYRRPDQLANLSELKKYCSEVNLYRRTYIWSPWNLARALFSRLPLLNISYLNGKLENDLTRAVRQKRYQLVHFEFLGVASLLPKVKNLGSQTVFGTENIESQIYERYSHRHSRSILYPLFGYDVWKMKRFETELWREADLNLAVSEADQSVIEASSGKGVALVRNGVEIKDSVWVEVQPKPPTAFFSGDLNYQPNRNGLAWFLREVLPLVKSERPDFKLLVLSSVQPNFVKKYRESVEMIVDRQAPFEDFVAQSSLFISPVQIKSGTNIKVLQAAAAGLPIVGTAASFSGYDFENGRDVWVADHPAEFSQAIVSLLKNRGAAGQMAQRALARVQKYNWDNSAKILSNAYQELLS